MNWKRLIRSRPATSSNAGCERSLWPPQLRRNLRALAEPMVRSKSPDDESVASFSGVGLAHKYSIRLRRLRRGISRATRLREAQRGECLPASSKISNPEASSWACFAVKRTAAGAGEREKPRRASISSFSGGLEIMPLRIADNLQILTQCSGIRIGKDVRAKATVLAVPAYRAADSGRDPSGTRRASWRL